MTILITGQVLALAFACGLNLYLTVAALGILARIGVIDTLPPGLSGLEGLIVIGTAATLAIIEVVVDKVGHIDSLWDIVHTFIRPSAAALLTVGALWGFPITTTSLLAGAAFLVALAAHGTKAGLRLALNTRPTGAGHFWVSLAEDLLAVALATAAFLAPREALIATGVALLLALLLGPRYWRAFGLGLRALRAWLRALFTPGGWREGTALPRRVRRVLDPTPVGAAPPRGAPAALHGLPGVGAYRNGWVVLAATGTFFVYRTVLGTRRMDLPAPRDVQVEPGIWVNTFTLQVDDASAFRLYLLKDGPPHDLVAPQLQGAVT